MTDLKKLLDDSILPQDECRRVAEHDALLRKSAFLEGVAAFEASKENRSFIEQAMTSVPHSVGLLGEKVRNRATGLAPKPMTAIEQMEEAAAGYQKQAAGTLAWAKNSDAVAAVSRNSFGLGLHTVPSPPQSFKELMRQDAQGLASMYQSPTEKAAVEAKTSYLSQLHNPRDAAWPSSASVTKSFAESVLGLNSITAMQASKEQMHLGLFHSPHLAQTAAELFQKENTFRAPSLPYQNTAVLDPRSAAITKFSGVAEEKKALDADEYKFMPAMHLDSGIGQHIAREQREIRRREDAKLKYAREGAEALKEALEMERQRTAAALKTAAEAKQEARRSRRSTRIALWFAGASLMLTAWPFIKDQF